MKLKAFRVRTSLRSSLWFVPALCVAGAFVLAQALLALDRALGDGRHAAVLFGGGPESARAVLSTVAASMITFTGVVFSVTMLVLQLASAQYSPRVLRTFLRDLPSQVALGVFVATFVYALAVLRTVRSPTEADPAAFVPTLSITVALLLILVSIGLFVQYINHIAQSIRPTTIIARVAKETRDAIERMYPSEIGMPAADAAGAARPLARHPDAVIPSPGPSGILLAVDGDRIVELACRGDLVLGLVPMIGDFVPAGGPLFEVWGDAGVVERADLATIVSFRPTRTMEQDPAFGFRQLVDIAERALSPGVNDPTTAVEALDELHDLLRRLARRAFPSPLRTDDAGRLRAVLPRPAWEDYVALALDEIRQYGTGSIQVMRRLRALVEDVRLVATPDRRAAVEQQLALLDAAVEQGFDDPRDRRRARTPGFQGHGPSHPLQPEQVRDAADGDGGPPSRR